MSITWLDYGVDIIKMQEINRKLFDIVRARSYTFGESKKLASGKESRHYFNLKMTLSTPEGLSHVADLMLNMIQQNNFTCDYVGGVEMGSVPIANAIAIRSFESNHPIPLVWMRKQKKDHGTQSLIEGEVIENLAGKTVVMTEDVTTTAGSVLTAIESGRSAGLIIDHVLTIVDREEGAMEKLREHNIQLHSIFKKSDFI